MKKKIFKSAKYIFIFLFFVCIPALAVEIKLVNPLGQDATIESVLSNIMSWLVELGAPVAALMVVVGGLQMLFASGNPEKFKKGQQTILYTAIGYGIILVGNGLVKILEALLRG